MFKRYSAYFQCLGIAAAVGVAVFVAAAQPAVVHAQDGTNSDSVFIVPPTSSEQPGENQPVINATPAPGTTAPGTAPETTNEVLENLCAGANFEFGSGCDRNGDANRRAEESFSRLIKTVVNIFSTVVGVVAVIMILIGGLRYITSGGDSSNVASAKNTILYVLVGLVVVAMSQFIVRFVISRLSTAT